MDEKLHDAWLAHRVSYGETDAMGVVYYAEYIHYFERSRNEFCRVCGTSYRNIEKAGYALPVKEVQCRYRKPAHFDELLHVHVWIEEWRKASIRFQYEIYDESHTRLLCEGMTLHAFTTMQGHPVAIPDWLKEELTPKHT